MASSSLEICLSQLLNAGDFATPQTERDSTDGGPGEALDPRFFHGFDRVGLPILFGGHAPLKQAYRLFGERIAGYRVITAERNPWDRAVSLFYWSHRKTDMRNRPLDVQIAAFRRYLRLYGAPTGPLAGWRRMVCGHRLVSQRHLYSLGGVPCADIILRFEHLAEDLAALSDRLKLPVPLDLDGIHAKAGVRAEASRELDLFYDQTSHRIIRDACRWEIENLGYSFGSDDVARFRPDPRRIAARNAMIARYGRLQGEGQEPARERG